MYQPKHCNGPKINIYLNYLILSENPDDQFQVYTKYNPSTILTMYTMFTLVFGKFTKSEHTHVIFTFCFILFKMIEKFGV